MSATAAAAPTNKRRPPVCVTEADFSAHCSDYDGLCLACGEWTSGGVEPDAEEYECEVCGSHAVIGAEDALIRGRVEIMG